jgi:hypothetical protein
MTENHSPPAIKIWCTGVNPSHYFAKVEGVVVRSFPSLRMAVEWVYKTLVELRAMDRDAALSAVSLAIKETKAQSNRSWLPIGEDLKTANAWLQAEHHLLHSEDEPAEPPIDDHPTG